MKVSNANRNIPKAIKSLKSKHFMGITSLHTDDDQATPQHGYPR